MLGVGVEVIEHLADVGDARLIRGAAARLGEQGLSFAVLQPGEQTGEDRRRFHAGCRRPRAIGVEVLVDVKDEIRGAAVRVGDAGEGGGGPA